MPDLEARENPYNVRQASRIYFLPNLMTAGNLFCGFVAVIKCIQARLETIAPGTYTHSAAELYTQAVWFILAAVIFDSLDGRLARLGGRESLFGAEFDSLADVISFGVAPAALGFAAGMQAALDIPVLLYFVACGVSRLARFNVTAEALSAGGDKVKYFEGTPIPSSVLLAAVLAIAAATGRHGDTLWLGVVHLGPFGFHPMVLMFAVSGSLMVSKTLRIPKF